MNLGAEAGATTTSTVPIGVICSCTGPEAASLSQTTPSIEAWAAWVNHHGGLNGHHVKLTTKDDGYNPSTSSADASELIQQDHVVAIVDNSDVDASWSSYAQQQGVPVIGGGISLAGYTNPDFFPPSATFNYLTSAGAILAKHYGVKKQSDLYCSEVAICSQSAVQSKAANAAYGIDMVYTAAIGFAAPSYTAECLASKAAGATAMTVGTRRRSSKKSLKIVLRRDTHRLSSAVMAQWQSVGSTLQAWKAILTLKPTCPGLFTTRRPRICIPLSQSTHRKSQRGRILARSSSPRGPMARSIQAAVHSKSTDNITAATIKSGIYALPKGDTLGGLAPPLHFVKGQPANNSCFFTMTIKNHKFEILQGGKLLCAPLHEAGWKGPGS